MAEIELVGDDRFPPGEFIRLLETRDVCFGKHFAKSTKECRECLMPILVDGNFSFIRDLCEARMGGLTAPIILKNLSAADVLDRLSSGKTVQDIFKEILAENDPVQGGAEARRMLSLRLTYIRRDRTKHGLGLPAPDLPSLKELLSNV